MAYLLEKSGSSRCTLEANKREQFTQKLFSDLINDSHTKEHDYFLARVHCAEASKKDTFYCYDARQLCKYVFEMVISTEGRKIRIKNFKDPISAQDIKEVQFFRLKYDTDAPLKAEYVGNHDNFLDSNCFRSRIFCTEDALDALSVNFQFNAVKETKLVDKRRVFGMFMMIVCLLIFITTIVILIERDKKHLGTDGHKIGQKLFFYNKH
ncbi:hypothetical protein NGRA_1126 [Nosema granulosis]|uniref:Uncharacterized protein n=1 Tax=Nosema granulosis TaxID=83296 RepID=A0A9P6KZV9_9MICR|nr:hypothetical protein NGRA_1126 [Nosema granulosis]